MRETLICKNVYVGEYEDEDENECFGCIVVAVTRSRTFVCGSLKGERGGANLGEDGW